MLKHRSNSNKGFSLIEAVVATALFAFVLSSVMGVYLAVVRIDAKTRAERVVQQNARFIMDYLGKEIRNGSINYAASPLGTISYTPQGYATQLNLVNQQAEAETISCLGNNLVLSKTAGTTNLNSPEARITNCRFYIEPSTEPFRLIDSNPQPPNVQPHVTVVLQIVSNTGVRQVDNAVINMQSTFVVREYPTRDRP